MELRLNLNSEKLNSWLLLKELRSIMRQLKEVKRLLMLVSTSSLTGLLKNGKEFLVLNQILNQNMIMKYRFLILRIFLKLLIGENMELLLTSRIKVSVDLAGPSQPLVLLKVLINLLVVNSLHFQNNNLLTVLMIKNGTIQVVLVA